MINPLNIPNKASSSSKDDDYKGNNTNFIMPNNLINGRRHSFSFLLKPKSYAHYRKRSVELKHKQIMKNVEYSETNKNGKLSLAQVLLQLVKMYPQYVREVSDFVFDKKIGQGGFGEVWLGSDLRTGTTCAIKEIYSKWFKGRNLLAYYREVATMTITHNRFCVPFIGFTVESPYCIITEYMPGGALYDYLRMERINCKQIISGTHLTMIAMGIADSLRHLHSKHIIHRDIKSPNILLDHRNLPRLCDFGIARVVARNRPLSVGLGTPGHIAPDVLTSRNYGTPADIFSYAMLLYEMIEKHRPFPGLDKNECINAVKRNQRPTIKSKFQPDSLIKLIELCWDQNPSKRPTAAEIYKLFENGDVYFDGTDVEQIKKFAQKINEERKATRGKNKREIYAPVKDIESRLEILIKNLKQEEEILKLHGLRSNDNDSGEINIAHVERRRKKRYISTYDFEVPETVTFSDSLLVLRNYNHPSFKENAQSLSQHIEDEGSFPQFYAYMYTALTQSTDLSMPSFVINLFTKLIVRKSSFVEILTDYKFFSSIPVDTQQNTKAVLRLIAQVFLLSPGNISPTMFRTIMELVNKVPSEMLSLFAIYIDNINPSISSYSVIDFFLRFARTFINDAKGVQFITIVSKILKIEYLKSNHITIIRQILLAYICSSNNEVAKCAYKVLYLNYDESYNLPLSAISRKIRDKTIANDICVFLLSIDHIPFSKTLYAALSSESTESSVVMTTLAKFASQGIEYANLCADNPIWLMSVSFQAYNLFLYLSQFIEIRQKLFQYTRLCHFLKEMLHLYHEQVLCSLPFILQKTSINVFFIEGLASIGFFKELYDKITIINDQKLLSACCLTLTRFIRIGYTPQYFAFLNPLSSYLSCPSSVSKYAIESLINLSAYKPIASELKNNEKLINYMESIRNNQYFEKGLAVFFSNINNV